MRYCTFAWRHCLRGETWQCLGSCIKRRWDWPHPQLATFFPHTDRPVSNFDRERLRQWSPSHNKQLHSECAIGSTDIMRRSLFGLVHAYNRLPQRVIDQPSIKGFQRSLQEALKSVCDCSHGNTGFAESLLDKMEKAWHGPVPQSFHMNHLTPIG